MSTNAGPDWNALAGAQRIELTPAAAERLQGLWRAMLGMRGLIDWKEEPAISFSADAVAEERAE